MSNQVNSMNKGLTVKVWSRNDSIMASSWD